MNKDNKTKLVQITGKEANALLYGFDKFFDTGEDGTIHRVPDYVNMTKEEIQALRDKLFLAHYHE